MPEANGVEKEEKEAIVKAPLPPTPPLQLLGMTSAVGFHTSVWFWLLWRSVKLVRADTVARGGLDSSLLLMLPLAAAGGTLFVDTIGYFTHYFLDNYLSSRGLFGPLVTLFEVHHEAPRMDEQGFLENAWAESLYCSSIIGAARLMGVLNLQSIFSCTYFSFVGFWGGQISAIHKAAHMAKPGLMYRIFQQLGIIIDREYHGKHHTKFTSHYSLCTGHFECMFEKLQGVAMLESVLYLFLGVVSRHSILGLEVEQQALLPNFMQRFQQVKYLVWYKFFNSIIFGMGVELHFMNWGYQKEDGSQYALPAGAAHVLGADPRLQVINGISLQLYLHMLQGVEWKGKRIVEVSSGRGGFLAALASTDEVESCVGIDTCAVAVSTCNSLHENLQKVRYQQGDAMGDFGVEADIVVNVEASHCYPSRQAFFGNVRRALRGGGVFLFADFMSSAELPLVISWLQELGFTIEVQDDITAPVRRAMAVTNEAKVTLIRERFPRMMWGVMERFAATEGSVSRGDAVDSWHDSVYVYLRCSCGEAASA